MAGVVVYADGNFSGASQEFGPGRFNMSELTVGNDKISSVRVPPGWSVTLFQHSDYQGTARTFTADTPWVGGDFNDQASSIAVTDPAPPSNALTDFDMCLALTQIGINSQLHLAWGRWKQQRGFTERIRLFKTTRTVDGAQQVVDSKTGLEATVESLTVNLNVPGARPGQVEVTLPLVDGAVTYVDDETAEYGEYRFDEGSVSFLVDLDRRPVDLATLAAVDPDARSAADTIVGSLSESVFSIEYLFMKFTDVDLLVADNRSVHLPDDMPEAARTRARRSLTFLLQRQMGEFMLGSVVRRKPSATVRTPTFAMTDFAYDVHANPDAPEASTLAYLGMFSHRPLPGNLELARAKLDKPWVPPQSVDGTKAMNHGIMAIRKGVFMDEYFLATLSGLLGRQPVPDGLRWTYSFTEAPSTWEKADVIRRVFSTGSSYTLTLAAVPGTNTLSITGMLSSYARMDGLWWGSGVRSEWIRYAGRRGVGGRITFTGSKIGTDFSVVPGLVFESGDLVVDEDEVGGGAKAMDFFENWAGDTTAEKLAEQQKALLENLTATLKAAFDKAMVKLTEYAFIPPGGGVFTYQEPRFSGAGDLTFDAIYQAPRKEPKP